jgi:chromosome segregation ATPase
MTNLSLSPKVLTVFAVTLLAAGGGEGFYAYRLAKQQQNMEAVVNSHGDLLQKLDRELEQSRGAYSDLQNQLAFTRNRLGSTEVQLRKAQQVSGKLARQNSQAVKQWSDQLSSLQQAQTATQGTIGTLSSDVAGVKTGLSSTQDEIASTRSDLQRTIGDLGVQSGLIARNHDELEELKSRGERDYVEFNLTKNKQSQRLGNVSLSLKKADVKRQRYTVNLIADDHAIEKKDKTANEPVQFYESGYRQPTELVVNQVLKDRIVGYIAFPKKREARPGMAESADARTPLR